MLTVRDFSIVPLLSLLDHCPSVAALLFCCFMC